MKLLVSSRSYRNKLKLTFVANKPPPPQGAFQEYLLATDPPVEYFS